MIYIPIPDICSWVTIKQVFNIGLRDTRLTLFCKEFLIAEDALEFHTKVNYLHCWSTVIKITTMRQLKWQILYFIPTPLGSLRTKCVMLSDNDEMKSCKTILLSGHNTCTTASLFKFSRLKIFLLSRLVPLKITKENIKVRFFLS